MGKYTEVQKQLLEPFPIDWLEFRPGGRGTALTYVEVWRYYDRLDTICPEDYEIGDPMPVLHVERAGEDGKTEGLVAYQVPVTICGRTAYGVSDLAVPTKAVAQAIKRGCAAHGLGRYLYFAPTLANAYKGYDLTVDPRTLVIQCYDHWHLPLPEGYREAAPAPAAPRPKSSAYSREEGPSRPRQSSSGKGLSSEDENPHTGKLTFKQVNKLYGAGLTDSDIEQLNKKTGYEAVQAAFGGALAEEIRDQFGLVEGGEAPKAARRSSAW